MEKRLRNLAIGFIVYGFIQLSVMLVVMFAPELPFIPTQLVGEDGESISLLTNLFYFIVWVIMIITPVLMFISAYAILKKVTWFRNFSLVVSVISLLSFPFGTILGVYGILIL